MTVVSNTSPMIFLAKVEALVLLPQCFNRILVPHAVVTELGSFSLPSYIQPAIISPVGKAFVKGAIGRLHAGELEVMMLAQEASADLVLMDDLLARRKAQRLGLKPMGTVGVLLLAQQRWLVSKEVVIEKLDQLIHEHGFYLSPKMLNLIKSSGRNGSG
jgi:predicted nucleic acid-binding protein